MSRVTSSITSLVRQSPAASVALPPTAIHPALLQPTYVNGRWRKPAMSAMAIARARKQALASGQVWTLTERSNRRRELPVKLKGHKAERVAPARAAKVAAAMKEMPRRVEEYYKQQRALRAQLRITEDDEDEAADAKKAKRPGAPAKINK